MSSKKHVLRNMALTLFGIEFFAILVFYIPNFVIPEFVPGYLVELDTPVLAYAITFINRFLSFVPPLLAAAALFSISPISKGKAVLYSFLLSLTTLIYYIPYYYLTHLYEGFDSIESILISSAESAVTLLLFAAWFLILYAVMMFAAGRLGKKAYIEKLPFAYRKNTPSDMAKQALSDFKANLPEHLREGVIFDLTSPAVFGIFAASFVQFFIFLLMELIPIIEYLYESSGNYIIEDIIFIVAILLFVFIELFAAHALCYLVIRLATKGKKKAAVEEAPEDAELDAEDADEITSCEEKDAADVENSKEENNNGSNNDEAVGE